MSGTGGQVLAARTWLGLVARTGLGPMGQDMVIMNVIQGKRMVLGLLPSWRSYGGRLRLSANLT